MSALVPAWSPVKIGIRRLSDLPNYQGFLAGGAVVQGVTMDIGARFLVFGETNAEQNGIFELATLGGGTGIRRPVDADDEDDFDPNLKQVRVLDGDYVGLWAWVGPFTGLANPGDPSGSGGAIRWKRGYVPTARPASAFATPTTTAPRPATLVMAPTSIPPAPADLDPPEPPLLAYGDTVVSYGGSVILASGTVPGLTVTSPVQDQVFQYGAAYRGSMVVTGTYTGPARSVVARWNGGSWRVLAASPSGGRYSGSLSNLPVGQGTLEVQLAGLDSTRVSVPYVGIGLVVAVWGQSNGSGRGVNLQVWSHPTLRASNYGNDYQWKLLSDPYDSAIGQLDSVSIDNDPAGMGSTWMRVAHRWLATRGFPIAFVPCCKGSTGIAAWSPGVDPLDRGSLFGSALYRTKVSGAKFALWWQGEGGFDDASGEYYVALYKAMTAAAVAQVPGLKFVPAKLQYCTSVTDQRQLNGWLAIQRIWDEDPNSLRGPTLASRAPSSGDDLVSDDGFHLTGDGKIDTAAQRWFAALNAIA